MSYNVTSTKIRDIKNLRIGFKDLLQGIDLEGQIKNNEATIYVGEGSIEGKLDVDAGEFVVTKIQIFGEGSGNLMHNVVTPLLKKSKGYVKLLQVWEGGDSIYEYEVNDGQITEKELA